MKFFKLILPLLPILLFYNCDDEYPDCVCTEEFRMYFVTVVDSLGNPIDSLHTLIKNSRGKEYDFGAFSPPSFVSGAYFVMTDGYQNDFRTSVERIIFVGTKKDLEVSGEYLFNTDECRCHIYKVAGPDTLVLK